MRPAGSSTRLPAAYFGGHLPKVGEVLFLSESGWASLRAVVVDAGYAIPELHYAKGGRPAIVLGYVEDEAGKKFVEVLLLATFGLKNANTHNHKALIARALWDYVAPVCDAESWPWPEGHFPIRDMNCAGNWVILLPLAVNVDSLRTVKRWRGTCPNISPSASGLTLASLRRSAYENYYKVLKDAYYARDEALRLVKAMRNTPYADSRQKKAAGALPDFEQAKRLRIEIHRWTGLPGAP
ncbi:hypothetical protein K525DRAFT_268451 [Schizophyllum commune Loenen D]|nr:hypothetical protein K525DRAFT_268451 [Schizophyllum commune Loenen D]